MLRNAKDLQGITIHATDVSPRLEDIGSIEDMGAVADIYLDDESWGIRYLVVDTGNWLTGRLVLISPISISQTDWDERKITVRLTREQVKNAPGIETDRPVTRQHEAALSDYYNWPYYWIGGGVYGIGVYPGFLITPDEPAVAGMVEPAQDAHLEDLHAEDSHLQSANDVIGFRIEAADGDIGHVEDFILDDENWAIRYIEVDTRNWWPGKKVLFAPRWIQHIDWTDGKVRVNLLREIIQNAPEYDPTLPITRQYEVSLFDYYGRFLDPHGNFRYWLGTGEDK